ncbi:MAG: GNAT family N-acetyltransferase [Polyangiaceae bacterium]
MEKRIFACVARSKRDIADAQQVRNEVFVKEKGLLQHGPAESEQERDAYDELDTTLHFIGYMNDVPVGTVRLLRPNPGVARAIEQPLGIDLASRYDLWPFVAARVSVAEVSRLCVVPHLRGGAVLGELYLAMYRESARIGLTHWVAAGNAETDVLEDAKIAYRIAALRGLVSHEWHVEPRPSPGAVRAPTRPFYSEAERARARAGDLHGLRLPRTLETFTRLAGRYMGPPIRERGYTVCSLPLVVDLAHVGSTSVVRRALSRP